MVMTNFEMLKVALVPGYVETFQRLQDVEGETRNSNIKSINKIRTRLFLCLIASATAKVWTLLSVNEDTSSFQYRCTALTWQFPLAAAAATAHYMYQEIQELQDALN